MTRTRGGTGGDRSGRGRSRWVRVLLAGMFLLLPLLVGACTLQLGCRTYSLFEPGTPSIYYVDESRCVTAPAPVVPESALPILLPAAAGALLAGTYGVRQVARRRRGGSAA